MAKSIGAQFGAHMIRNGKAEASIVETVKNSAHIQLSIAGGKLCNIRHYSFSGASAVKSRFNRLSGFWAALSAFVKPLGELG